MREDSFDLGSYDPEMDGYEPSEVSVDDVTKGDRIGEGSFAVVFAGTVAGVGDVVLKQYRRDVRGRDWFSFYADERAMCRRLRECPGVAPFVGVAGSDLYLVWRDVGKRTLANVMEDARTGGGGGDDDVLTLAAAEMGLSTSATDAEIFVAIARGGSSSTPSSPCQTTPTSCMVVPRLSSHGQRAADVRGDGFRRGARVLMVDHTGGAADYETGQGTDGSAGDLRPVDHTFYRAALPSSCLHASIGSRSRGIAGMFAGFGANRMDPGGGDLEATGAAPTAAFDAFGVGMTLLRLATPALHPAGSMKLARSRSCSPS